MKNKVIASLILMITFALIRHILGFEIAVLIGISLIYESLI